MSANKVNLRLPQIQLVARVDCYDNDNAECSVEILEHQMLSLNLFDAKNLKFFLMFNARLKISLSINGREESIVVVAEEFELSSVDTIGDSIYDFDFEESTIGKDELYRILNGGTMSVSFYTITD